jgi:hypothetical protein
MDTEFELKKIQNIQKIQEKVKEFIQKKIDEYISTKQQALESAFPGLSKVEYDCLLNRYVKLNRFIDHRCKDTDIEMPERYIELLNNQKRNGNEKIEFLNYQKALEIPSGFNTPDFYNSLFPVKNTLLALQIVNRLAREYEIRVEDVETVIQEVL